MSVQRSHRNRGNPKSGNKIVSLPPRIADPAPSSIAAVSAERENRRRLAFIFPLTLVIIDAALIALGFWWAFRLRLLTEYVGALRFDDYYGMLAIQVPTIIGTFFFYRLYNRRRVMSLIDEFGRVLAATSVGTVITLALSSLLFKNSADFDYPRLMVFYAWGLTILMVTAGRYIHAQVMWRLKAAGVAKEKVLVVGGGETAQLILNAITRSPHLGYEVVGVVEHAAHPVSKAIKAKRVGTVHELAQLIDRYGVDEVIIGLPEADHHDVLDIIYQAQREKVSIKVFPDLFQFMAGEMTIGDLNGLPLLTVRDIALRGWKLGVKRTVDVVLSFAILVLFSPLLLLIAFLVKLESKGPVFFTQIRMGLDAKPFRMIKFRSMRIDAEQLATWTTENDPRITRIGGFLRKTSLDEFPQFINVLLGEMSIVGPRPEQPKYVEEFQKAIPRYMDRHRERAGVTGWAQVNGLRGDTSIYERTKYDLWYIENWSLLLDFKIILRTAVKFLIDRSAY
jgi:exopolysaccharide biosynthesis polyprenyl glycosylphosphotransferase